MTKQTWTYRLRCWLVWPMNREMLFWGAIMLALFVLGSLDWESVLDGRL